MAPGGAIWSTAYEAARGRAGKVYEKCMFVCSIYRVVCKRKIAVSIEKLLKKR